MVEPVSRPPLESPIIARHITGQPLSQPWHAWFAGADRVIRPLFVETTWNPGLIAPGDFVETSVTVPGTTLGDRAEATLEESLEECILSAEMDGANTVRVLLYNPANNGNTATFTASTLRVWVTPTPR